VFERLSLPLVILVAALVILKTNLGLLEIGFLFLQEVSQIGLRVVVDSAI
jgi:hypothetical protein